MLICFTEMVLFVLRKGELLNKYVIYCTFMCVDVVRTAGVRLSNMRELC